MRIANPVQINGQGANQRKVSSGNPSTDTAPSPSVVRRTPNSRDFSKEHRGKRIKGSSFLSRRPLRRTAGDPLMHPPPRRASCAKTDPSPVFRQTGHDPRSPGPGAGRISVSPGLGSLQRGCSPHSCDGFSPKARAPPPDPTRRCPHRCRRRSSPFAGIVRIVWRHWWRSGRQTWTGRSVLHSPRNGRGWPSDLRWWGHHWESW